MGNGDEPMSKSEEVNKHVNEDVINEEAHKRNVAINELEKLIFYIREKNDRVWGLPDEVKNLIDEKLNQNEEWLWDHMIEKFTVYEDRSGDLKHLCNEYVDDFKPKPEPEPEPQAPVDQTHPADNSA